MRLYRFLIVALAASSAASAVVEQVGEWQFEGSTGNTVIVNAKTATADGFGLSLSCIGGGPGSVHLTFIAPTDMGRAARSNQRVVRYTADDRPEATIVASHAGTSAVVYGVANDRGGPELVRSLISASGLAVELRGTNGITQNGTIAIGGAEDVLAKVASACSDSALAGILTGG